MNPTGVVALVLGLVLISKLFGDGLTQADRTMLRDRFTIAPLWQRFGLEQFSMDNILRHYAGEDIGAEDVAPTRYIQRRFAVCRTVAAMLADSVGLVDFDEEKAISGILSLESKWEVYWVNVLLLSEHGVEEVAGELLEEAFSDQDWLKVLPRLYDMPDFNPVTP